MVSITIDLSDLSNRIVELYKTDYGMKNKNDAIEKMILTFKSKFSDEKLKRDWRNDPAIDKQLFRLKELGVEIKDITKFEADKLIKEKLK